MRGRLRRWGPAHRYPRSWSPEKRNPPPHQWWEPSPCPRLLVMNATLRDEANRPTWRMYVSLMQSAGTALQRAMIHAHYCPFASRPQMAGTSWMMDTEGFSAPWSPDLLQTFHREIGQKPDAAALLQQALDEGKSIPEDVLAGFPQVVDRLRILRGNDGH